MREQASVREKLAAAAFTHRAAGRTRGAAETELFPGLPP